MGKLLEFALGIQESSLQADQVPVLIAALTFHEGI
jgi:hypothetical protein